MLKRKKDEGFTLIELMIVIAVIGILAVVLIPKIGNVKTSAKLAGVQTNYQSIIATVQAGQSYYVVSGTDAGLASVENYLEGIYGTTPVTTPATGMEALQNPLDGYYGVGTSAPASASVAPPVTVLTSTDFDPPITTAKAMANYAGTILVVPSITGANSGTIAVYALNDKGVSMMSTTLNF